MVVKNQFLKRAINFVGLFVFLFVSANLRAQTPVPYSEPIQDDPIAAALDSLYKLNLFEKGYAKINYTKSPKYNFPKDSVPRYDDMVYEVAKM